MNNENAPIVLQGLPASQFLWYMARKRLKAGGEQRQRMLALAVENFLHKRVLR